MLNIRELSFGYCVNGLKFSDFVTAGTITFLVGANGSGKTSLLKTLAGIIPPLEGGIEHSGSDILRPLYLPAHPDVTDWLTGEDVFEIFSTKDSRWVDQQDVDDLQITGILKDPLHLLSLGEQKRIFIAAALRSEADMILLDEPLNSLDWNMEFVLYKILKRHIQLGRTFLIAAHQLQWLVRFQNSQIWFVDKSSRLKSGGIEDVLTSTDVQKVFNFKVQMTDNPIDGSRLVATSDL